MNERGGDQNDRLSAAALELAITEATVDEARLRARLAGLVDERNEKLISGSDDEVDEVEAELDAVTRLLDRFELKLPLLHARHTEQLAAEQQARREADLEAAIAARISAAVAVDAALARLGPALRLLNGAERRLNGAGAALAGSTSRRDLIAAIRFGAPELERATGIPHELALEARPLADAEREAWARFRRDGGLGTARPARAAADRAAPVEPVSAADLERSGRYGSITAASAVELGSGWSDTDGDGGQEVSSALAS